MSGLMTAPNGESSKARGRTRRSLFKDVFIALFAGAIMGACFVIGKTFYSTSGRLSFADPLLLLYALIIAGTVLLLFLALFWVHDRWYTWHSRKGNFVSLPKVLQNRFVRRGLLIILILIMWTPAFLAFFPGNYSSDGPIQVSRFFNDGVVDLHWPAAHTLVLSGLMSFGNSLFGSFDVGLTLYCIAQGILLAFALAVSVDKLFDWGVPPIPLLILLVLVSINPIVQSFAFSTTKDSFFAAFFLLTLVYLVQIMRNATNDARSLHSLLFFGLSALGMCLMRKQGLYVLFLVVIVSLPFIKGWTQKLKVIVPVLCTFAASIVFGFAISQVFSTNDDSVREVLSVPSQQIARTYMLDYPSLSEDDLQKISKYYDIGSLEAGRQSTAPWEGYLGIGSFFDTETGQGYLEPIADPAKGAVNEASYSEDVLGYWAMWFSLLSEHEGLYLEAFLWGDVGYVYPTSASANRWSVMVSPWNEFSLSIKEGGVTNQVSNYTEASLFPAYRDFLVGGSQTMYSGTWLLTLAVSPAIPFLVLIVVVAFSIRATNGLPILLSLLLPLAYWVSLALGPVMCTRYVVPFFYSIPFLCGLILLCSPPRHKNVSAVLNQDKGANKREAKLSMPI